MKQVTISKGQVSIQELPAPKVRKGEVLVKTAFSLISAGTEISGKNASKTPFLEKVLKNPDNIKKGIDILANQGLKAVMAVVEKQQEAAILPGYSVAGIVVGIYAGEKEFKIGDRVACAGMGKASHAEFVSVPDNLVAKIPQNVDFKDASSVTLGAIAMQGLRRADVKLGENVAVVGLGLLGLILVQLLKANGARVAGIDINDGKLDLAKELGSDVVCNSARENVLQIVSDFTGAKGVDSVIITASAPGDNRLVQQAMEMARKKGKVVVVGDVGLNPQRSPFYEKEIDFLISTSYGPGRYDPSYEEKGIDYPFAYVRWTEKRNMEEYLRLLSDKKIDFLKLVSKIFFIEDASAAYDFIQDNRLAKPAVLLDYHFDDKGKPETKLIFESRPVKKSIINVGIIGLGNFAKAMHIPNLKRLSDVYKIYAVCDLDGMNAKKTAQKAGADYCTTDYRQILNDKNIDMVMVTLPHDLHAGIAAEAARSKKAVFCEKPMALNDDELKSLEDAIGEEKTPYWPGFNRRFSPLVEKIRELASNRESPLMIDYQMNAGYVPLNSWIHGEAGGGRNIGEACHIYDLFTFLTDSEVASVNAVSIGVDGGKYLKNDNFCATLKFKDGSVCSLIYTAAGAKNYSKEFAKIYFDGKMIVLDDFRSIKTYGSVNFSQKWDQDKGHYLELKRFADYIKGDNKDLFPLWQAVQATMISFEVERQIYL